MEKNEFRKALDFVLMAEGGYVNHPNDIGGETNFGITKNVYDAYRKSKTLPLQSVKQISQDEVEEIYYKKYYVLSGADKIKDAKLSLLHFDTAVNMGITRANSFLTLSKGILSDYFRLRKNKYFEFAKIPSQKVFLQGWLNRLGRLENYLRINY